MTPEQLSALEELAPSTPAAREKRLMLVHAAAAVMSRKGYAATSMKDIAQEAGIAQGLIHYYFDSKDELVIKVLGEACAQMLVETKLAFSRAQGGPLERIWPALDAARERVKHRPDMFRLFFELLPLSFNNPNLRSQFVEVYQGITQGTVEIIEEMNGLLPVPLPIDPRHFARVITAAIDGIAVQSLVDPGLDVDGLFSALALVLLSTVAASFAAAGQPIPGIEDIPALLAHAGPRPD